MTSWLYLCDFLNDRRVLDGRHRVLHLQLRQLRLFGLDALLQVAGPEISLISALFILSSR